MAVHKSQDKRCRWRSSLRIIEEQRASAEGKKRKENERANERTNVHERDVTEARCEKVVNRANEEEI